MNFIAVRYYISIPQCIHSSDDRNLGCLEFSPFTNCASVCILVCVIVFGLPFS